MKERRSKPKSSARSYALWLLGRQPYTAAKLRERLLRRGYDEAETGDAVNYLLEIGYLDDSLYATNFVSSRALAGHGPRKLRWELRNRGVAADVIDEAISQVPQETLAERAEQLAFRRLRGKDLRDPKVISSVYRHLLQRGYDYDLVEEAVQKARHHLDRDELNS
ncbi:MAG TPA: regulatory protein RecX [Firmicutes bacterium]|jgi:regulatory protein|nr:regulatory protein RecX [Bacillota bacterium]